MRMSYEDLGDPSTMSLVLLHGITQTGARDWSQHLSSFGQHFRSWYRSCEGTDQPKIPVVRKP